jgi:hypothetical protein
MLGEPATNRVYGQPDPEDDTNYIDRHKYVDTNYVSSGEGRPVS